MSYKFGVIGNCQRIGFAQSVSALVPGAEVSVVWSGDALRDPWSEETERRADELVKSCDVIFTQPMSKEFGYFSTEFLRKSDRPIIHFPATVFTGFHPDAAYIVCGGKNLRAPISEYHSALVAASFLAGLSEKRALNLFNKYIYVGLGYIADFTQSLDRIRAHYRQLGCEFNRPSGRFMHTINHPAIEVIFDAARQALERAGIVVGSSAIPADDLMEGPIWPVYPELADHLGCSSDMVFRGAVNDGRRKSLNLVQFIHESYEIYRHAGEPLISPAVERVRRYLERELFPAKISSENVR